MTIFTGNEHSDVSYGALRLLDPKLSPPGELRKVEPVSIDLKAYRARWRAEAERMERAAS
jgi:hypothetical protein